MGSKKDLIWLWVIGMVLTLIFVVEVCLADPTTAPIDNIVRIYTDSMDNGCGTGFILRKGTVLTAKHVVAAAEKILIVEYSNGIKEKVKVKKCRVSDKYDLAEIPVKKDKAGRTLEISHSGDYIGKRLYSSGYPGSWGILWVTIGVMSSEVTDHFSPDLRSVFLSDIDVVKGNSGSPVFDYTDRLVGVVSSKYLCVTLVVSTEALKEFLDE